MYLNKLNVEVYVLPDFIKRARWWVISYPNASGVMIVGRDALERYSRISDSQVSALHTHAFVFWGISEEELEGSGAVVDLFALVSNYHLQLPALTHKIPGFGRYPFFIFLGVGGLCLEGIEESVKAILG